MALEDKVCLVTGGSRNLGRAICLELARQGAKVAFTYKSRDEEADESARLLRELGAEALVFKGDVADGAHAKASVKAVLAEWGRLDVLVNNAGLTQILPLALLEERDWDAMMATNVKGPYLFSREALKSMIKARAGRIINIGAFGTDRPVSAPVHYAASKGALEAFTIALAAEVGRYGILVNTVKPGLLQVGLSQRLPGHRVEDYKHQTALGSLVAPQDVAASVAWLASDDNQFVTGATLAVDGGL